MGMYQGQNAGRSPRIMIDNISFERVEQFEYLTIAYSGRN